MLWIQTQGELALLFICRLPLQEINFRFIDPKWAEFKDTRRHFDKILLEQIKMVLCIAPMFLYICLTTSGHCRTLGGTQASA